MSFRSVSALPTCLHGRLAVRCTVLRRSFATCQRCSQNFPHIASDTIHDADNYVPHVRLSDGTIKPLVRFDEQRKKLNRTKYDFRSVEIDSSNDDTGTSPEPQAKSRIGAILNVPKFIYQDPIISPDAAPVVRHQKSVANEDKIQKSQPLTLQSKKQRGYKEWEELHDKFLHIRRTAPDRTAEIFNNERQIAQRFVGEPINNELSATDFDHKWQALSTTQRKELLPILLVGSLVESAKQTLFVLVNVGRIPTSFRIRVNCLRHIGIMYWRELHLDPSSKAMFEAMIDKLRSPEYWPKEQMPAVLLQIILLWSTPEQCQKIIENVKRRYPKAQASYMATMMGHYLRIKDQEQAFDHFKQLPEETMVHPDSTAKALRDKLIKQDIVVKSENGTNFKYLPQLLALGIPPDEALHNTVIESALLNKLPDVAWDVYQYLESSKFQTSPRSHLVLLQDAFKRRDLQKVNEIMSTIHNRDDLIQDQYLMAYSMNIVRNIRCYDHQLGTEEARSHIMALYDRAYDRAPLVKLGLVQPLESPSSLPLPPPTSLAFIIWTCILIQRRDRDVIRLWQWIKHLISEGDIAMADAARYDIIYNGLILFYARRSANLLNILDVMQFMLAKKICLPTSKTWSMLLCAFLKHGRLEEAQKIIRLMRARGFTVHKIHEMNVDDVRPGQDLRTLADKAILELDETEIPAEITELLAESPSLQREQKYLMP